MAPGLKIAYVAGTGDEVPAALENLGVKVSFLAAADLAAGDLSRFDAILLGVRAYAARPDLIAANARLLDYVRNGGVAIVQYNTPEFDNNFGPYPYVMGRNPEEVTDEASKVAILNPDHPLFQWPNRITEKDFDGLGRGARLQVDAVLGPAIRGAAETHDAGQEPQKGGLLLCALRERRLHLQRLGLLPAAPRGRSRRLSYLCEPVEPPEESRPLSYGAVPAEILCPGDSALDALPIA